MDAAAVAMVEATNSMTMNIVGAFITTKLEHKHCYVVTGLFRVCYDVILAVVSMILACRSTYRDGHH